MARKKNPNAVALGRLGGKARASSLPKAERSAIAKKGAAARNAKLSAADRSRIAHLAVQARERRRKIKGKEN
jgi:diketogulonate reductase-like aldo/keto reductase